MKQEISSVQTADHTLEYFNHFHDGFIKRLVLTSRDEFDANRGHVCTGTFDIEMDFAHYNYAEGKPRYDQIINAHFFDVRIVFIDLREMAFEWAILSFDVKQTSRREVYREQEEQCLVATLLLHKLVDNREWVVRENNLFTFQSASFEEK